MTGSVFKMTAPNLRANYARKNSRRVADDPIQCSAINCQNKALFKIFTLGSCEEHKDALIAHVKSKKRRNKDAKARMYIDDLRSRRTTS